MQPLENGTMSGAAISQQTPSVIVWLVEDDKYVRDAMQLTIAETPGYTCPQGFSSVEETIEALKHADIFPHVILLDISLRGMSGLEGIPILKAMRPDTHIIIMTQYHDEDKLRQALQLPISGYVTKDEIWGNFTHQIEKALRGEVAISATLMPKKEKISSISDDRSDKYGLTEREREVIILAGQGLTTEKITNKLRISQHTVNEHLKHIYAKLEVHSLVEAVAKFFHRG